MARDSREQVGRVSIYTEAPAFYTIQSLGSEAGQLRPHSELRMGWYARVWGHVWGVVWEERGRLVLRRSDQDDPF